MVCEPEAVTEGQPEFVQFVIATPVEPAEIDRETDEAGQETLTKNTDQGGGVKRQSQNPESEIGGETGEKSAEQTLPSGR